MAKKARPVPQKDVEAMAAAVASGKRPTSPPPPKRKPRAKKPLRPEIDQAIREAEALQWTVPPSKTKKTDYADAIANLVKAVDYWNEVSEKSGSAVRKRINAATGDVETYSLAPITKPESSEKIQDLPSDPIAWQPWVIGGLKAVTLLVLGMLGGVWIADGVEIGGNAPDAVSAVFDTQESEFRKFVGQLAGKLKAGEFASEKAATDWMDSQYGPASESAWVNLLTAEAKAFGGEQWTAEKHAAFIQEYVR